MLLTSTDGWCAPRETLSKGPPRPRRPPSAAPSAPLDGSRQGRSSERPLGETITMYPGHWASITPDKPATINANTGGCRYATLNPFGAAGPLQGSGLGVEDHVALFMKTICASSRWPGRLTAASTSPASIAISRRRSGHIVNDCDASILTAAPPTRAVATRSASPAPGKRSSRPTGPSWLDRLRRPRRSARHGPRRTGRG